MVWNIDEAASTGTVQVKPGDEILRLKLLPPGLYRAGTDVLSTQGLALIPAGTQLARVKSRLLIACTFSPMGKAGVDQLLFVAALKRICLVDSDGDGRFDASFVRATNSRAFFLLRGRLANGLQPIAATALEALAPAEIIGGPRLSLKLNRRSRPNGTTEVSGDVGDDNDPFSLSLRLKFKPADLPAVFPAYGGAVQISPATSGKYSVTAAGRFSASELDFWD